MLAREDGSECLVIHLHTDLPTTAQTISGRRPYNFHTRDDNGRSQTKVYIYLLLCDDWKIKLPLHTGYLLQL